MKKSISFFTVCSFLILCGCKKTDAPSIVGAWSLKDVSVNSGYTAAGSRLQYDLHYQDGMIIGIDSEYTNGSWGQRDMDTLIVTREDWQFNSDGSLIVSEASKYGVNSLTYFNSNTILWQLSGNNVLRLNQNRSTLLSYLQQIAQSTLNTDMSILKVASISDHQLVLVKQEIDSVDQSSYQYSHLNCTITFSR